jgi:hypothetical protein
MTMMAVTSSRKHVAAHFGLEIEDRDLLRHQGQVEMRLVYGATATPEERVLLRLSCPMYAYHDGLEVSFPDVNRAVAAISDPNVSQLLCYLGRHGVWTEHREGYDSLYGDVSTSVHVRLERLGISIDKLTDIILATYDADLI